MSVVQFKAKCCVCGRYATIAWPITEWETEINRGIRNFCSQHGGAIIADEMDRIEELGRRESSAH